MTAWLIWQVVGSLYEWIGLPDWVPPTALVILLLGLPVVLTTAFVQQRARTGAEAGPESQLPGFETATDAVVPATEDDHVASSRPGARGATRVFTWERSITAMVLAFAALGLAATGFMGMRALGIGPAATLLSSGVLEAREPILLADFGSPSGDSAAAAVVTEALRIDLEQSPVVRVLQPAQVAGTLERMARDPGAPLTPELAREVAIRDGITAWLEGEVTAVGDLYVLTARLVATATDEPLISVRETASRDDLVSAVDQLSRDLRERIGESFKSIRASEPLAQVTTSSLEALRKYSQGVRAYARRPGGDKAIALLEEAVEIDTAFAMAWRKLGVAYHGEDRVEALRKAYAHRDRLTDRERYLTLGTYFSVVDEDHERAVTAYERLLDLHPDESTALHNLAGEYAARGDTTEAIELYRRAIAVEPYASSSYSSLAVLLGARGDYQGAVRVLRLWNQRFPEHASVPYFMVHALAAQGKYDSVLTHVERFEELADGPRARQALFIRADVAAVRGRIREAEGWFDRWRAGADPSRRIDAPVYQAFERAYEDAMIEFAYRHDRAAAWRRMDAALDSIAVDSVLDAGVPGSGGLRTRLVYAHARFNRDVPAARRYLDELEEWERVYLSRPLPTTYEWDELNAYVAAAGGNHDKAVRLLRRSHAEHACTGCLAELAWVFERAGRPDSAITYYEAYLDEPDLFRLSIDGRWRARSHERLGALYEARGDQEEAARHYAAFVSLWEDADPELQPRVEAARRALARLTREGAQ